jgi:hypothetical protein
LAAAAAVVVLSNAAEKILTWSGRVKRPQEQLRQRLAELETQCAEHTERIHELISIARRTELVHAIEESPDDVKYICETWDKYRQCEADGYASMKFEAWKRTHLLEIEAKNLSA